MGTRSLGKTTFPKDESQFPLYEETKTNPGAQILSSALKILVAISQCNEIGT